MQAQISHQVARGDQQLYKGEAVDLTHSRAGASCMCRFARKDLEVIEVYETQLIAEALDGQQYQVGIEEWEASRSRQGIREDRA